MIDEKIAKLEDVFTVLKTVAPSISIDKHGSDSVKIFVHTEKRFYRFNETWKKHSQIY
ncbi:hypothetical protein [Lactobacillus sp. ESL0228]|jgi:hypothetical protein|uniref:hypothetical protein n=1 Tax=Lactobacillus sp. ESL0228 TaxID=2069352 RepID=UPI001314ADB5|nr:hypothetical protein [Lactobacillus sp. ESL0228]